MARIDLVDVSKTLDTFSIRNLSLRIPDGRTLVILGPSGCGKTTLLKLIAGLIAPDSGEVRYDGVDVQETPPGERRIGMVFQNYALYPHMTSRSNVMSYFTGCGSDVGR
jgi:ABC-type sugar transport system ATPase subunit